MARPFKDGLEYFSLDTDIDQDDKIFYLEAKHGSVAFVVVIKLLCRIYKNSYYTQWGDKEAIMFSKRINVDINVINDVVIDCLTNDSNLAVFDRELYETYGILTSRGIQNRYLEACIRRKKVKMFEEYLLLEQEDINSYKNLVIAYINPVNGDNSTQSKRKVKGNEKETKPNIYDIFMSNGFGSISPIAKETIDNMVETYTQEWVEAAIDISVKNNVRKLTYIDGILQRAKARGSIGQSHSKNEDWRQMEDAQ